MRYIIQSGTLYTEADHRPLAKIKRSLTGPGKMIFLDGKAPALRADIRYPEMDRKESVDLRKKEYVLVDGNDHEEAAGKPDFAEGDDPEVAGWPVNRLPRVDHARVEVHDVPYLLNMRTSREYSLEDEKKDEVLRITHRGISGGWDIEDRGAFSPEILCGLFVFCRYIEQENEFLIV